MRSVACRDMLSRCRIGKDTTESSADLHQISTNFHITSMYLYITILEHDQPSSPSQVGALAAHPECVCRPG